MSARRSYSDIWVRRLVLSGLATAIVGSTVPTPLYPIYRAELGLDAFTMTIIFVVYVVAVLTALLCLPPILTRLRNPYQLFAPALTVVAAGALIMSQAHDLSGLLVGRFFSGLGSGSVTLAANVLLIELAPRRDVRWAANASVLAFGLGSAGGPLLSGAALQLGLWPLVTPFLLIALSALLSFHAACQRWRTPYGTSAASDHDTGERMPPVPPPQPPPWGTFALCASIVFVTWGLGASMMALGPLAAAETLNVQNYALSGYAIALFMIGTTASLWFHRRTPLRRGLIRGCWIVGTGVFACGVGIALGNTSVVLLGMALTAAGYGGAYGCAASLVPMVAPPALRPRMISLFYVAGYIGNLFPLLTGGIADFAGVPLATAIYLFATALALWGIAWAGQRILPPHASGTYV